MELSSAIKRYWSILLCSIFIEVIVAARVWFSLRSGFLLPDEAIYYGAYYDIRWFFHAFLYIVFNLFQINTVWQYLCIVPFILSLFQIGILLIIYLLTKSHWVVMATFLTTTFLVNVPFILSDGMALFFTFLGIYLLKEKEGWYIGLFSASCLVIASILKEPFIAFAFGNVLLIGLIALKRWELSTKNALFIETTFIGSLLLFPKLNYLQKVMLGRFEVVVVRTETTIGPHGLMPIHETILNTIEGRIQHTLTNFGIGLFLGWGVVNVLLIIGAYFLIRSKEDVIVKGNVILGFLALLGVGSVLAEYQYSLSFLVVGSMIRLSQSSLVGAIGLKTIFGRFNPKKVFPPLLIVTVASAPFLLVAVQSNLSVEYVNRVDLNYKAPWLRLSEHVSTLGSSKILVFAEPVIRARIFLENNKNVSVVLPLLNETEFLNLVSQDWTYIFFYGEKHTLHYKALEQRTNYYYQIVVEKAQVEVVWDDEESYLLRWKANVD